VREPLHIPEDVRSAVLARLERHGVEPIALGREFLEREGYGSFEDYLARVRELYGDDEVQRVRQRMTELAQRDQRTVGPSDPRDPLDRAYRKKVMAQNLPGYALVAGPDAEFLNGIEYAMDILSNVYSEQGGMSAFQAGEEVRGYIEELFAKRAVPYRYEDYKLVWAGDRGAHQVVIQPALQALADARLAGARNEFEAALGHLLAGTQKDREDAIEESAKSVESAMKVLIPETSLPVAPNATAQLLFNALRDGGALPAYADNLVLAAARIRNKMGGHGAGAQPRQIDLDIATAAVNAAAAALVLLGGRLP
jgi:hypothetical protein